MNASAGGASARIVVVAGGTDGMGRALALARARRGDRVVAIGSNAERGRQLAAEARGIEFLQADLSSLAAVRAVLAEIGARHEHVDALALFANRVSAKRVVTAEGLERTFALYYVSRYLLSHGLTPLLERSDRPVIVNVAGVGATRGEIHWNDLSLAQQYSPIAAQLQAGRANDLLGVGYAAAHAGRVPYVLYHPGFTRSGNLSAMPAAVRLLIRTLALVRAQPVERAVAPIDGFIDAPPAEPLTAVDRGAVLPLDLPTLDPAAARRLAVVTADLVAGIG